MHLQKTEATLFSAIDIAFDKQRFQVKDSVLPYNNQPKILGIVLDEKMTFEPHVQMVEKKSSRALKVIREVKGIADKISTKKMINLYTTMVRSIIEYGAFIWQGTGHMGQLEAQQRKALAICLNFPQTSGREAMEVATGILPLDLRLSETAVRELSKIQAKKMSHPLKATLNDLIQTEPVHAPRHVSPMALAISQAAEMENITKVSFRLIEPEPDYEEGSLYRSLRPPEYWSRLGSSKSRTNDQEILGREVVMDLMIMEAPLDTTFAFIDGSCIPNPGPCGAGVIIFPSVGEPVLLKQAVSKLGSILLAELVAVLMVLEHLILHPQLAVGGHLQILSDSQTTVGIISQGWKRYSYKNTIEEIKKAIKTLTLKRITVELLWIPGHAGLQDEKADQLAKEAAEEARSMPEETRSVSIQDIKVASHKACLARWQSRWQNASTGRQYHEYVPQVDFKRQFDLPDKVAFNRILQLQTGYTVLNAHRHKVGKKVSPCVHADAQKQQITSSCSVSHTAANMRG